MIGRLAPSPTGAQHVGNARTYLIAWLSARAQKGEVRLRIEDIDSSRIKPGADTQILADLRNLGLDWAGEVVTQSHRIPLYESALDRLRAQNLVYPCTCTRADIDQAGGAPHQENEERIYPGLCAYRHADDVPNGPFCWRFRVPERSPVFDDAYYGRCEIDLRKVCGDFVVWKTARPPNGTATPAYQLAVVVDDAAQSVTEVIRGDDLIPSTPRQLLLYAALGLPPPRFAHVPLVVGPDGRRLAKRRSDTRLDLLHESGVSPKQVIGLLAWSCGWLASPQPITPRELVPLFRLDTIPKQPFVLLPEYLKAEEEKREALMTSADLSRSHLRVARPTDDLDAVVRFYRDGLGFSVLGSFSDHDAFDGVMLGHTGASYHLEFTRKAGHEAGHAPTQDNLLVFYLPDRGEWQAAVDRLLRLGHQAVASFNPYWDRNGATFEDPDGYRIVLQNAAWGVSSRSALGQPADA